MIRLLSNAPYHALGGRDGAVLATDDGFAAFLAMEPRELRRTSFLTLTYPPDLRASLAALERLAETGAAVDLRKRYIRGDGVVVWAQVRISLLRGADGGSFHSVVCTPAHPPANDDGISARVVYC